MNAYALDHLDDGDLLRGLAALVARDRTTTAHLLAHLAEVDARQLYRSAAYPSLFEYCIGELRMSEDAALKRIQAARVAREFPEIFAAIADGRLHLSGVNVLARHLSPDNASALLAAATHRTKAEIERLVANWFPLLDAPAAVRPIESMHRDAAESAAPVGSSATQHAPAHVDASPRTEPVGGGRVAVTATVDHAKWQYVKELLSHQLPSGDIATMLDLALDALIAKLEKRKFAATKRPNAKLRMPRSCGRYIPAAIKREVWKRDGAQCTFTSAAGHRCTSRTRLEFDHVLEVARGGESTADNLRLRCRAHNQYAAEQTFGAEHMNRKREEARERRSPERTSPPVHPDRTTVWPGAGLVRDAGRLPVGRTTAWMGAGPAARA